MGGLRLSRWTGWVAFAFAWLAAPAPGQTGAEKISDAVVADISATGQVVVIVQLASEPSTAGAQFLAQTSPPPIDVDRIVLDLAAAGVQTRHVFQSIPYLIAQVDSRALNALAAHPNVAQILPDVRVEAHTGQSAAAIRSDLVVDLLGFTGAGATIAVLDTGIETTHPDLIGAVIGGRRFLNQGATEDSLINDDNGHGTHVAGIISGDGVVAPRGIAPDATLLAVKVLDGAQGGFLSDVARGIDWLTANRFAFPGLIAANLSLGTLTASPDCPCDADLNFALIRDAITALNGVGVVVIASTGNSGLTDQITAPACLSNVISVGATYDEDAFRAPAVGTFRDLAGGSLNVADCFDNAPVLHQIVCFSNRAACMDFLAPGYLIEAPTLGGSSALFFGTSSAAPHVVATLALMKDKAGTAFTMNELVDTLRAASPLELDIVTSNAFRRIDAAAAVLALPSALTRASPVWARYY